MTFFGRANPLSVQNWANRNGPKTDPEPAPRPGRSPPKQQYTSYAAITLPKLRFLGQQPDNASRS
jgi:hypothetical protein